MGWQDLGPEIEDLFAGLVVPPLRCVEKGQRNGMHLITPTKPDAERLSPAQYQRKLKRARQYQRENREAINERHRVNERLRHARNRDAINDRRRELYASRRLEGKETSS